MQIDTRVWASADTDLITVDSFADHLQWLPQKPIASFIGQKKKSNFMIQFINKLASNRLYI